MTTLLLVALLADIARCESGHDFADGEVVVAVAQNRYRDGGFQSLTRPQAFALGCPAAPRTPHWRHLAIAVRAVLGLGKAPRWAREARFFCAPRATPGRCHERRLGALGRLTHTFYARSMRAADLEGVE